MRVVSCLLIVAGGIACASRVPPGTSFVRLDRTECLGECPVYTVILYLNGVAMREGRRFAPPGRKWGKVAPVEVERLMAGVDQIPAWQCAPDRLATDFPWSILTVSRRGASRRIAHYHGDPCAPDGLLSIEADIAHAGGAPP